jgi:hypothetical protein
MGHQIDACYMDPTTPNWSADRCPGFYYQIGRRIGALYPDTPLACGVDRSGDSTTQWDLQIDAIWILPHQIGQRIGAVDPTTQ